MSWSPTMSTRWSKAPRATARDVRPLVALRAVPTGAHSSASVCSLTVSAYSSRGALTRCRAPLEHGHRAQGAPAAWSPSQFLGAASPASSRAFARAGRSIARVTRSGPSTEPPRAVQALAVAGGGRHRHGQLPGRRRPRDPHRPTPPPPRRGMTPGHDLDHRWALPSSARAPAPYLGSVTSPLSPVRP